LIIDYAEKNNITLNIEENDITEASKINNYIKILLENYKNKNLNKNIVSSIKMVYESNNSLNGIQKYLKENGYNETEEDINKILLNCVSKNQLPKLILLLEYANKNNIVLKINNQDNNKRYPFLWSIMNDDFKMAQLIVDYAVSKKIILKINEEDINENYPILYCTINNNVEMARLIINYATENNIKLKINEKNKYKNYPLLLSINKNNTEMVRLIVDYAINNNIVLNIEENDIKETCVINEEIKKILEVYKKNKRKSKPLGSNINNDLIQKYLRENGYKETEEDINKLLLNYIAKNQLPKFKVVLKYANQNNIILKMNEIDSNENYPLLWCTIHNNIEMAQLIIDYADSKNIILNLNEKNKYGSPILWSSINNNLEMAKLIINYASKNNIKLKINEKNINKDYPLLLGINKNNIEMVKLIIDYADKNNIILSIEEKDFAESSKINNDIKILLENYMKCKNEMPSSSINSPNGIQKGKSIYPTNNLNGIQKYLKENGYNEVEEDINVLLSNCIVKNQLSKFKLIMEYANKNNIILKMNEINMNDNYPLLWCTINNNLEIAQLIINYANSNEIILKINEVDVNENYPLLWCTMNNNLEMAKLIINYAIENNIKLKINEQNKNKNYPLLLSINKNNVEMVKLIVDYANQTNIILKIEEKDIIKASIINKDIKDILENYKNKDSESNSQMNNSRNSNDNNNNCNNDINNSSSNNFSNNSMKGKGNVNDKEEKFAIAEYDFITNKEEELSFRVGNRIKIINWNFKEGWAYGCKCDDSSKKGAFPKPLVILENNNNSNNGLYIIINIFQFKKIVFIMLLN